MRLSELKNGQSAIIMKVNGYGGFRKRIMEMGFVRGKTVTPVLNAPLNDPIKYDIMGYEVSLRKSEAAMIEVFTEDDAAMAANSMNNGVTEENDMEKAYLKNGRNISIALVGNPNCGKTSLFNHLSGGHEHVGNYSGVTVESKNGSFKYKGYRFTVTDLPGTYALSAYSPEELYVRKHIIEKDPDVIINVVAASNIERNLYLTTELIDISHSLVIALNMFDALVSAGATQVEALTVVRAAHPLNISFALVSAAMFSSGSVIVVSLEQPLNMRFANSTLPRFHGVRSNVTIEEQPRNMSDMFSTEEVSQPEVLGA